MFFKSYGILGQNARNLGYIREYNTKFAKNLADSKLKTKEFLKLKGVSVPETLFIFKDHSELNLNIFEALNPPFVVKPNAGFGGKGILIFIGKTASGDYITNTDKVYTKNELLYHFSDILDGFYSLSGNRDKVIIEKKIELEEEIDLLGKYGLPDIRVITFNMVPIMAMLRVPTKESSGKANLHSGACGVGIDIGTGKLTYITSHSKIVKQIPGIGDVRGIILPSWDKILTLAVTVQQVTNIGYIGCDIVLDKNEGPLLLEMNVRPGLEVQVANMAPLKDRLERVEGIYINTIEKGVRLGRDLFSGDIEEKIKNLSGKKVLGAREYLSLIYDKKTYKYLAEIKPSSPKSYIDKNFLKNVLKFTDENLEIGILKMDITLLGEQKKLKFVIKELSGVNIILGINALKGFLIDPFKYKKGELPVSDSGLFLKGKNIAIERNYKEQLEKLDKDILAIDKKLIILKYFTPTNIELEKKKFVDSKGEYIPKFEYNKIDLDLELLEKKLKSIEVPEIPLAKIYKRKLNETINKLKLLKALRDFSSSDITHYSKLVYGNISKDNLVYSNEILSNKKDIKQEDEYMSFEEMKAFIKKFNHIYGINVSLKSRNIGARFVMKGDILFVRENVKVGKKEFRSIIAHEIEGHYLRKVNGKKLAYSVFSNGTSKYLEIDEGIAVYNQNRFLGINDKKYYSIYERYYFINFALENSYKKLLSKMLDYYNNDYGMVFKYLLRIKRGLKSFSSDGVFMKDCIYVNGFIKLEDFIASGNKLKDLYIAKISIDDLEILKDSYILKINYNDIKLPLYL